jgi:uncharacterized protein DUF4038/collagenase-like protein with putative collagen-binding domain
MKPFILVLIASSLSLSLDGLPTLAQQGNDRGKPSAKPTKLRASSNHRFLEDISARPFFAVAGLAGASPFYPLKVGPTGRYLVDQNNVPFMIVGNASQSLIINLTHAQVDSYFADRQAHGFNSVWVALLRRGLPSSRPDGATFDGIFPFTTTDDLSIPNNAYFARADDYINLAASHGITVFLDPVETAGGWLPVLRSNGTAKAYNFGVYLGSRYKNVPNIVWLNGNDYNTWRTASDDALVTAVANGIKSVDANHLQTVELNIHYSSSLDDSNWAPLISLNAAYVYAPTYLEMLHAYNQSPTMPAFLVEAHYELESVGKPSEMGTPSVLRRQAYWTMLAGGTGQLYGNAYTWTFKDGWQTNLDTPGVRQLGYWKTLFSAYPWYNLVPDQNHTVVTAGYGTFGTYDTQVSANDFLTAACAPKGSLVMAYAPTIRAFTIDMTKLSGPVTARWFDPANGTDTAVSDSPFANTGTRQFTPPGNNSAGDGDWVLVLTAHSGSAPPPPPLAAPTARSGQIKAPLRSLPSNPNYFTDGTGKAIYLTGSQTWNTLQDWGTDGSIQPLDFTAFVNMLVAHQHNFTLLWAAELPTFRGLPNTASSPPDFSITPQPWQRTGPGNASDGKAKFDLTKYNQAYFDRLHDRVQQLDTNGIYAGVYLFTGEFLLRFRFSGDGYPFTGSNNVNGIDDRGGNGAVTMTAPNAITAIQDAYVKKVIDTLNDLPNVLWIVSEEAPKDSKWWNNHLIALTRTYEAGKPFQHPIGYGATEELNAVSDSNIINSDADWIAPGARISPTSSCGSGHPACKVNINDSDHSYFGIWNDSPQVNRNFFWINFTQGDETLFMDPYVVYWPREKRNLCPSPVHGISSGPDPRWENMRNTMGYIRGYAEGMNLAAMTPQGNLSSTGHTLANTNAINPELLVYAPSGGSFSVNLSGNSRQFAVEWMNPATGVKTGGASVSGGVTRTFNPPFSGDAVLYLRVNPATPN